MKKKELEKALEEEKQRSHAFHQLYLKKRRECNGMIKVSEYLELLRYTEELEEENKRLAKGNVELTKDITALSRVLRESVWNYR